MKILQSVLLTWGGKRKVNIVFFVLAIALLSSDFKVGANCEVLSLNKTVSMKGIASLLVMINHCANAVSLDGTLPFLNVGWYCVALFFFFSGFGLNQKKEIDFKGRVIKIIVPYMMAYCVYLPVKRLIGIQYGGVEILQSFIGGATVVDNSWFPVASVIMCSILCLSRRTKHHIATVIVLIVGVTVVEVLCARQKSWWYISNLAFVVGVLISEYDSQVKWRKEYAILGVFLCAISVLIPRYFNASSSIVMSAAISNIKSASIVIITISAGTVLSGYNPISKWFGRISYETYLIHGLFITLWKTVFGLKYKYLIFLLVPILSVFTAFFLCKIDKKIVQLLLKKSMK